MTTAAPANLQYPAGYHSWRLSKPLQGPDGDVQERRASGFEGARSLRERPPDLAAVKASERGNPQAIE